MNISNQSYCHEPTVRYQVKIKLNSYSKPGLLIGIKKNRTINAGFLKQKHL